MAGPGIERDFKILELNPDATLLQVKNAYIRLKKLYSDDSSILSPISQEFSEEKRHKILLEVEGAYSRLLEFFRVDTSPSPPAPAAPVSPAHSKKETPPTGEEWVFSGPALKRIREDLGIPLHLIFHATKIRVEQLEAIEEENFAKLPDEAYLKAHLKEVAGHLSLNPKKVVHDYLKRYSAWKKVQRRNE